MLFAHHVEINLFDLVVIEIINSRQQIFCCGSASQPWDRDNFVAGTQWNSSN